MVEIKMMKQGDECWDETMALARGCSWSAGGTLADKMKNNDFLAWERVICARVDDKVVGYATFAEKDELPEEYEYTPFVGFVFVEEAYRGRRLSELMIREAWGYARELDYENLYIMSGEDGLYEKYGFKRIGEFKTIYGWTDQLLVKPTRPVGLIYRDMTADEVNRITEIDATYFIKNAWRMIDGEYQLVEINWTDTELPNGLDWHLMRYAKTFESGGRAVGCFDGDKLVGYATINAEVWGERVKYVLLDQLFVSKNYRAAGIGKQLMKRCQELARKFGASHIYLCAGSSENTLAFYKSIGCQPATERNQELYEEDPRDIQMDLPLYRGVCDETKGPRNNG